MSRSYRKPYVAACGVGSCKDDKRIAHRGVRRSQNAWVHQALKDPETDIIFPHFRECHWNDVYNWKRDGKQHWCYPDARAWDRHMKAVNKLYQYPFEMRPGYLDSKLEWPPRWYLEALRK